MTKEELKAKFLEKESQCLAESERCHSDDPVKSAAAMLIGKAWASAWRYACNLPDDPEPEPPKKARRINLTNRDGYWYWEVWQEEGPGSWAKVFSMTMGYASIAEAANLAKQWMEKNP